MSRADQNLNWHIIGRGHSKFWSGFLQMKAILPAIAVLVCSAAAMTIGRSRLPLPIVSFNGDFDGLNFTPLSLQPPGAFPPGFMAPLGSVYSVINNVKIFYVGSPRAMYLLQKPADVPEEVRPFFNYYNTLARSGVYREVGCLGNALPVCANGVQYRNVCLAAKAGIRRVSYGNCGFVFRTTTTIRLKRIIRRPSVVAGRPGPLIIERPVPYVPQPTIINNYITAPTYEKIDAPTYSNVDNKSYSNTVAPTYTNVQAPAFSSKNSPSYTSTQAPSYTSTVSPNYSSVNAPYSFRASLPSYSTNSSPSYASLNAPTSTSVVAPTYSSSSKTDISNVAPNYVSAPAPAPIVQAAAPETNLVIIEPEVVYDAPDTYVVEVEPQLANVKYGAEIGGSVIGNFRGKR